MDGNAESAGKFRGSEVWHRIDYVRYAPPLDEFERPCGIGRLELWHQTYRVIRGTPKGVWLEILPGHKRFVLIGSKRQYASPTLAAAKHKFRKRKERQMAILKAKIREIEEALDKLDELK